MPPVLSSRIQCRRGTQAQFESLYPPGYDGTTGVDINQWPQILQPGEFALCTDTSRIYVGNVNGTYAVFTSGSSMSPAIIIKEVTGDYTIDVLDSFNTLLKVTSNTPVTITVPSSTTTDIPIGAAILVGQNGTGSVTFEPEVGVTILSPDTLTIGKQYGKVTLIKVSPNQWELEGNLLVQI